MKPCVRCHQPHASPLAICDACLRPPEPAGKRCQRCGIPLTGQLRRYCPPCAVRRHNDCTRAYQRKHRPALICRTCKAALPEGARPGTLCHACQRETQRLSQTAAMSHPLPCGHSHTRTSFHFVNARELEFTRRCKQCNWSDVAVFEPDPKGLRDIARGVYEQL